MTKKRGRPAFQASAGQRRRVSILAGGGMSHDEIALALSISDETLRKYFADELSRGAYKRRAEVLESMFQAARNGNVTAQKAYVALNPALAAPPPDPDKPEPAAPTLGKKEQAQQEATTAQVGTDWADLLPKASMQ